MRMHNTYVTLKCLLEILEQDSFGLCMRPKHVSLFPDKCICENVI